MNKLLSIAILMASAAPIRASIIETISFDLSGLHAGSILSGTFTLPDTPLAGNTATAVLSFSDPADYSPTALSTTITVMTGTPSGFALDFSPLSFTNLSGVTTPIDTRDVSLTRTAFANCTGFPCTASGGFQDRSPAVFSGRYTITSATPEPGYTPVFAGLLIAAALAGRRLARREDSI